MQKPNFFLVGAPKCGTTAMSNYLNQHPDIHMGPKEMHFFGTDLRRTNKAENQTKEKYLSRLNEGNNLETKYLGEASVWYLYSQTAASEIKTFSPEAKILIMLRNPVEMLYSLYYQWLHEGKFLPSFQEAIEQESELRQKAEPLFDQGKRWREVMHTDLAKFYEQVAIYFNVFGQENVKVVIYDDFKKNISQVYQEILEFLEIDSAIVPQQFERVNSHKRYKNYLFHRLFSNPHETPELERKISSNLRNIVKLLMPKKLRKQVRDRLINWNTVTSQRPEMAPEVHQYICKQLSPDIKKLSSLLNRDLTYWCQ
ncbi:MAG: sulfotransferase [Cyanobacteria bacterium P01_F01_bin.143]